MWGGGVTRLVLQIEGKRNTAHSFPRLRCDDGDVIGRGF
jgi:hypothetical protein